MSNLKNEHKKEEAKYNFTSSKRGIKYRGSNVEIEITRDGKFIVK